MAVQGSKNLIHINMTNTVNIYYTLSFNEKNSKTASACFHVKEGPECSILLFPAVVSYCPCISFTDIYIKQDGLLWTVYTDRLMKYAPMTYVTKVTGYKSYYFRAFTDKMKPHTVLFIGAIWWCYLKHVRPSFSIETNNLTNNPAKHCPP